MLQGYIKCKHLHHKLESKGGLILGRSNFHVNRFSSGLLRLSLLRVEGDLDSSLYALARLSLVSRPEIVTKDVTFDRLSTFQPDLHSTFQTYSITQNTK